MTKSRKTQPAQKKQTARKSQAPYAWAWYLSAVVFVVALFLFAMSQIGRNKTPDQNPNPTDSQTHQNTQPETTQPSEQPTTTVEEKPTETTESRSTQPAQTTETEQTKPATSTPSESPQTNTTQPSTTTCHRFESGRCWDDLEDEFYSAGIYDREYGYYGASFEYPDDCDAFCRDILEDAYDEGWYDAF